MSAPRQLCTFRLDGLWFGLPVSRVQEVLRYQPVTPVPLAPRDIAGLINLRGRIVAAVDLRCTLAMPTRPPGRLPGNVVVHGKDGPLSLLVDEIGEVLAVDEQQLQPPPDSVEPATRRLLRGVCPLARGLLLWLDGEKLLTGLDGNDG